MDSRNHFSMDTIARAHAPAQEHDRILAWLLHVPSPPLPSPSCASAPPPIQGRLKRKRAPSPPPSLPIPTPPTSRTSTHMPQTPRKSAKRPARFLEPDDEVLHDEPEEPTPRPPRSTHVPLLDTAQSASESTNTSQSLSTGGRSKSGSPRKRLRNLAYREDGLECLNIPIASAFSPAPISRHPFPEALRDTVHVFNCIDNCISILPHTPGHQIQTTATMHGILIPSSAVAPVAAQGSNLVYHGFGPTPSLEDAMDVVRWAAELQETAADEAAWNCFVHARLLCLALYPQGRRQPGLIGVTQCTSARITKAYLETLGGSPIAEKKVDFCFHVDPLYDDEGDQTQQVARLAVRLPLESINHTDHDALAGRPISVSIETKKPDAGTTGEAPLQVSRQPT